MTSAAVDVRADLPWSGRLARSASPVGVVDTRPGRGGTHELPEIAGREEK